jgi:hypothetical protein
MAGMFVPDPGSGFFSIPDPEVKKAPDTGPDSQHWKNIQVVDHTTYTGTGYL